VVIRGERLTPPHSRGRGGAGEGAPNPVGAVIAAAIDDALGMPGAVTQLPVTPQRLRALLAQRNSP
jgi:aerobic carbon-monoxide dehydrogenase large subunit